ncbi:hypothetical protein GCM10027046_08460 [Uliginosibacterium flavum]|uniref:Uncharacterized protein n=1 Tax=Uliginosibacterium flavum TaxID=1396831 RepID=A0ABV2TI21_9RHOO
MRGLFALYVLLFSAAVQADPCSGGDRSLDAARREALAPVVSRDVTLLLWPHFKAHFDPGPQRVLSSLRMRGWFVLYVDTGKTDDVALFYAGDPARGGRYAGFWGGSAPTDEGPQLRRELLRDIPGIPPALAGCFAWRVTQHPEQYPWP